MWERAPGRTWNRTQEGITEAVILRAAQKLMVEPQRAFKVQAAINFSHWIEIPEEHKLTPISWVGGDVLIEGRNTFFKKPTLLTVPFNRRSSLEPGVDFIIDLRHVEHPLPVIPWFFDPSIDLGHAGG